MRRRRPLCHKCQLEMTDDPVDDGIVCEERDDAHPTLTLRTDQRVDFGLIILGAVCPLISAKVLNNRQWREGL
ncbi:MAG: hypothetical protein ACOC57_04275 [Acidobacteriota bacterium]